MSNALDSRPLLVRLQKRIEKLDPEGHKGATPVDTELHRQSVVLVNELAAALKLTRENLRACQATIHLTGGFDPAYVNDAQAAMAVADAVLAKAGA
ncbi:hypothetical protein [Pseudomonas kribbensis]|uniref:hypothetical protein n=1 Tax=Pseudomonas kribbensis TaxID=1628086 RepID=UPI001F41755E|nr:hypothetical protein [Pseudomonas kribbensis]UIN57625.1 hypothetical protein LXN51_21775 [Pseudomonas kribbensis]